MNKILVRLISCLIVLSFLLPTTTSEASLINHEFSNAKIDPDQLELPQASANWEYVSTMPEPLGYFGLTQVDGNVFVFGGTNWDRYPLSTNVVRKFDPATLTWHTVSPFPEPVQQAAITLGQKVYIFGGARTEQDGTHIVLSSTWEYDTVTDQWTQKTDMPAPRMFSGVALLNNRFYVVGGSPSDGGGAQNTLFLYDPQLDSWSEAAPMPTARYGPGVVASQGKIFVFGGNAGVGLSVVEVYDPLTNTWSTREDMTINRWFDFNSVLEKDGKIYLVGGCTEDWGCTMLSRVDVYDVATDNWSALPDLPSARTGGGATIIDGILYYFGGYDYETYSDAVYAYDLESGSASQWLLMYYMAGDNDLSSMISSEYISLVSNLNPFTDVAIFYDTEATDTLYRYFASDGSRETIAKGNLNSGDGASLSDFILWAKQKSSALQTALIIDDHGHGLTGVAYDDRAGKDKISVDGELRNALVAAGPVDVLYSSTCLTGNIEFLWELRGITDFYVSSESVSRGPFNHSYLMNIGITTSALDLATAIGISYYSQYFNYHSPSTISVIDMSYVNDMFQKTNDLALAIKQSSLSTKIGLWENLDTIFLQRFDEDLDGIDNSDRLADLFHFASLVQSYPELSSSAQALLGLEDDFVIYDRGWSGIWSDGVYWNHDNARGVSISLPLNPISFYDGEWLEFAEGADWSFVNPGSSSVMTTEGFNWGSMVSDLVYVNNPLGEDDPLPPELLAPLLEFKVYLPGIYH